MTLANSLPPSFREVSVNLTDELMERLADRGHIAIIAPRQSGKAFLLYELNRRASRIPGIDQPRVKWLRALDFHGFDESALLRRIAKELETDLPEWDEEDDVPLSAKISEIIRSAAKASPRPLWIFIQNITEYPWPCARGILEALRELSQDSMLRDLSVVVTGNYEFVSLTCDETSPYRHARKYFLCGFDREVTHYFYRARAGGLPLDEGFHESPQQDCPALEDDVLDYLYEQTGGYARFIEELVVTRRRPRANTPTGDMNETLSKSGIEKLVDRYVREYMPFDTYCKLSLRDVQRDEKSWDELQQILAGREPLILGTSQPTLLDTSGIVRRDAESRAMFSSMIWERFLRERLTPRYRGDIYSVLGKWNLAWPLYEKSSSTICDRALDGEDRYLLLRAITAWEDSLIDLSNDSAKTVVDRFLQGMRHYYGCASAAIADSASADVKWGFPEGVEFAVHKPDQNIPDDGFDIHVHIGRRSLTVHPSTTEGQEEQACSLQIQMTRPANREFDSPTLARLRKSLRRFWHAFRVAARKDYDANLGRIRNEHLKVVEQVNGLLTQNPRDMKHIVEGAVDALLKTARYFRVLICMVSPKGDRIQAVCGACADPNLDFDYTTDLPLSPELRDRDCDIQQWVTLRAKTCSVSDASSPDQRSRSTQWERARELGARSICVLPLKITRRDKSVVEVLGTLHLEREHRGALTVEEVKSCEILANQLAVTFDQARRLSMLEKSLFVLDQQFRIVAPDGRTIFRNKAASDPPKFPSGWSFPITEIAPTTPGFFADDVIEDAAKSGTWTHRYVKSTKDSSHTDLTANNRTGLVAKAWDECAAPIEDFRRTLPEPYVSDGVVGYVHMRNDITDLVNMYGSLHEWLGATSSRETAQRILRSLRILRFQWCRIYLAKKRHASVQPHLESFEQFGIADARAATKFSSGKFRIEADEPGQQSHFLFRQRPELTVFRYDPTLTGPPILDSTLGRGLPVFRTNDKWRDEFGKTDDYWIEAPLCVGKDEIGLIALSIPLANRNLSGMISPEDYEKLRWCVVSVAVALKNALHAEQMAARRREEAWQEACQMAIHQLSNKLAPCETFIRLAARKVRSVQDGDAANRESILSWLSCAESGVKTARYIVKDFRRYASDSLLTDICPADVATLLGDIARHLRATSPSTEIKVIEPARSSTIICSRRALLEVCEVLFDNSLRHSGKTPSDLVVTLRAESPPESQTNEQTTFRVTFQDNGRGIATADRERIFQPFFTTHDQGNGLGLPIARRLLSRQDGEIYADEGSGAGASFVITLPAATFTKVG